MSSKIQLAATLAAVLAAAPAAAQTPVDVPPFDAVELRGGGSVTIRHGPTQRVTLVRGDLGTSRFTVDRDGKLTIRACVSTCRNYRLEVEIVTPVLEGAAINGGGSLRAQGAFPVRDDLALAINGGGAIDMLTMPADEVSAAINGGGTIRTHARRSLSAAIRGGGAIRYAGDPSVSSSINGGGAVSPVR